MIDSHETTAPKAPSRPEKLPRYQAIADLFRDAYGPKRKRLALSSSDLKAMQSASKLEPEQREDLLRLAASDRTLERSRELLLLAAERLAHHPSAGQLRDLLGEVLRRHPAYRDPTLNGVIANLPDAVTVDTAIAKLSGIAFERLPWPEGTPPLKKGEVEALRHTVVHCLLLWVRETRGLSSDRIQGFLQNACWTRPQGHPVVDARVLRPLMLARDRLALGIACSVLEAKALTSIRNADAARNAEQQARAAAEKLKSDLEETTARLERERSCNRELRDLIERERREHENDKAHLRNDFEELRGRILRRLRDEVTLLDEGLGALRKQPPKVHVMEDHAERAIDGLKSEIERVSGRAE